MRLGVIRRAVVWVVIKFDRSYERVAQNPIIVGRQLFLQRGSEIYHTKQ